jgi:hypothetical protein
VHAIQLRECRVRELEPQRHEGDDDPVGEHELVVRACPGRAQPLMFPPIAQPVFPGGHPGTGQLPDQLAQRAAADPGEDTMRQGRAGPF